MGLLLNVLSSGAGPRGPADPCAAFFFSFPGVGHGNTSAWGMLGPQGHAHEQRPFVFFSPASANPEVRNRIRNSKENSPGSFLGSLLTLQNILVKPFPSPRSKNWITCNLSWYVFLFLFLDFAMILWQFKGRLRDRPSDMPRSFVSHGRGVIRWSVGLFATVAQSKNKSMGCL